MDPDPTADPMVGRACSGCGARVEFPPGEVSTACSYCGSPLVDAEVASQRFDRVAPFRIERGVAAARLRQFLRGRTWAPGEVRRGAVRERSLRGVLVPFWVYQGKVRAQYRARVGIHWYRTETYRGSDGKMKTRTVKETEWFSSSGSAAYPVQDHLVSASTGLPEDEANALEPFDLGWAVDFDARLVSGWEAELPSVDASRADSVASEELRQICGQRVETELLPGDVNDVQGVTADVDVDARDMVLLPVWITTFKHGDEVRRLLVNGQTGACIGDVPTSWAKIVGAVLLVIAVVLSGLYLGGVIP